ncbi:MAG: hypothetical protein JSR19_07495 [Proteobacteria bacterium]|nr:hypothetical protein [Pseudomonadota bacterium]HQR03742.1 hypothetical protein [Rhodocyclaceae bacterium]
MNRLVSAFMLLLPCSLAWGAEPPALGRLFFTPEKRADLDQQRQLNLQESQTLQGATLQLDGVVLRSDGRKTVWINGRPQNDNTGSGGVAARTRPAIPGEATLTPNGEASVELKVGENINRATREKSNALGDDSIKIRSVHR